MNKQLKTLKLYEQDLLNWLTAQRDYPNLHHPKPVAPKIVSKHLATVLEERITKDFNRKV